MQKEGFPATVPRPSPMQSGPQPNPLLSLTPEKGSPSAIDDASLSSVSLPPQNITNKLAHPTFNSTRRVERAIEALDKENFSSSLNIEGPLDTDVNKVISVPLSVALYKDLTPLDVTFVEDMKGKLHRKFEKKAISHEDEPNILEFFNSDNVWEEATWDFPLPAYSLEPRGVTPEEAVRKLYGK